MEPLPRRPLWLPSTALLVFIGVVALIAILLIPGLHSASKASNERQAAAMLKAITSAEADFRENDRDHNKVRDFWTGDGSGLYYVKPMDGGPEVRLIQADVADSDAKPLFPLPKGTVAKSGYVFHAMERDDTFPGPAGEYKVDTDKSGRKVHNAEIFGFCAYPVSDWYGRYIFTVNENNTIFKDWMKKRHQPRTSFPNSTRPGPDWFLDDY